MQLSPFQTRLFCVWHKGMRFFLSVDIGWRESFNRVWSVYRSTSGKHFLQCDKALVHSRRGTMGDTEVAEAQVTRGTGEAIFGWGSRAGGADVVTLWTEAQFCSVSFLPGAVCASWTLIHTSTICTARIHTHMQIHTFKGWLLQKYLKLFCWITLNFWKLDFS